ncbi:RNA polymerase subunit sigma-24, partial [Streptomyces sp. NPDC055078]
MNEILLRSLTPSVIAILVRRGADFAAAEDAVQDALVEAVRVGPADSSPGSRGSVGSPDFPGSPDSPGSP